jgi:multisubunit Na+/H+ antiporter MnhC subunit
MMNRLEAYVYGDARARRSGDRISLAVAFGWYVIGVCLKSHGVLFRSILALMVCQAGTTLIYCLQPSQRREARPVERSRRLSIKAALSLAAALVLAALPGPVVEAALIDERLRRILRNPTPRSLGTAAELVSSANSERLLLSSRAIEQLVARRLTFEDVSEAVIQSVNQEAAAHGVAQPVIGLIVWPDSPLGQFVITGLSGEVSHAPAGEASQTTGSLVPPEMVAFMGPIGSRSAPTSSGAAYIRIGFKQGHPTVPLDGLQCKNIMFSGCTVIYSGGPVKLENTGFANCSFVFAKNLTCQKLAALVLSNPSVTFSASDHMASTAER